MNMFTVLFDGLMCHVGNASEKEHVAIVEARGHTPYIKVEAKHRVGKQKDLELKLMKGDMVRFVGIPKGTAKLSDGRVAQYVPALSTLLDDSDAAKKDLHDEVKGKKDHSDVVAYLIYPEGELSTGDPMPTGLTFSLPAGPKTQCVAVGKFMATVDDSVVLVVERKSGDVEAEVLNGDAVVRVTNSSQGNHFHHYRHLTKAQSIAQAKADYQCPDASEDLQKRADPNPECTNSGWP